MQSLQSTIDSVKITLIVNWTLLRMMIKEKYYKTKDYFKVTDGVRWRQGGKENEMVNNSFSIELLKMG